MSRSVIAKSTIWQRRDEGGGGGAGQGEAPRPEASGQSMLAMPSKWPSGERDANWVKRATKRDVKRKRLR